MNPNFKLFERLDFVPNINPARIHFTFCSFGAKFLSNKLGFVYNNEMDDFSAPNVTNEFGLPPSPVNFIKPGKRPQSSAVPVIMLDKKGNVLMTIGAAGGTIITTSVAQVRPCSIVRLLC